MDVRGGPETDADVKLGPATLLGVLRLRVRDLDVVSAFYEDGAGLTRLSDDDGRRVLGSPGVPILELLHRPELAAPPPRSAGLYHTAILFHDRVDLAAALYSTAVGFGGTFSGSADHLVSQAFYFNDPEGNGVELYWDRPRADWRWGDGEVAMDSLPLDPNEFISEHGRGEAGLEAPLGAPATLGHVHLKVGDIAEAQRFYVDAVGFDVTASMWQSALFASAGGYHHHIGMNVWESRGAVRREESLGLDSFQVLVTPTDLAAARIRLGGSVVTHGEGSVTALDPWGTRIEVVATS